MRVDQWLTGKKLSSIFVDATDGYRSREKGGTFHSLFLKEAFPWPPGVLGRTGREALGQVDSEPQGWELCWRDPRYLSTLFASLSCKSPHCNSRSLWGSSSPFLNAVIPTNKSSYGYSDTLTCPATLARLCPVHWPSSAQPLLMCQDMLA